MPTYEVTTTRRVRETTTTTITSAEPLDRETCETIALGGERPEGVEVKQETERDDDDWHSGDEDVEDIEAVDGEFADDDEDE